VAGRHQIGPAVRERRDNHGAYHDIPENRNRPKPRSTCSGEFLPSADRLNAHIVAER
jgi:hypothetical protein